MIGLNTGSNRGKEGYKTSPVMCLSGNLVQCFCQDCDPGSVLHSIDGRGQICCVRIWGVFWLKIYALGMAGLEIPLDPPMDNQTQLVTMLGEGLLEVWAPCHDSALAIGNFDVASYVLLKVDWDHEILHRLSQGSNELHKKRWWVEGEITPAGG